MMLNMHPANESTKLSDDNKDNLKFTAPDTPAQRARCPQRGHRLRGLQPRDRGEAVPIINCQNGLGHISSSHCFLIGRDFAALHLRRLTAAQLQRQRFSTCTFAARGAASLDTMSTAAYPP